MINKHYGTIELAFEDKIKCNGCYFVIRNVTMSQSINGYSLELSGEDVITYLDSVRVR